MGDDREDDLLDGGGKLTLDGKQALSYSRIRYVGNADFERTERQRTVMSQVMSKVKGNPFRLLPVCMGALPKMTTNMSVLGLYGYALTTPFKLATYDMQQQRVPADGTFQGADVGGSRCWRSTSMPPSNSCKARCLQRNNAKAVTHLWRCAAAFCVCGFFPLGGGGVLVESFA